MVTNIGFGPDSTHFQSASSDPRSPLKPERMNFPLQHPPYVIRDHAADDYIIDTYVVRKTRHWRNEFTERSGAPFRRRFRFRSAASDPGFSQTCGRSCRGRIQERIPPDVASTSDADRQARVNSMTMSRDEVTRITSVAPRAGGRLGEGDDSRSGTRNTTSAADRSSEVHGSSARKANPRAHDRVAVSFGISEIIINVSHLADKIMGHFGDGKLGGTT